MKVHPPRYIINLVSMVDGGLFDKLEALARTLRRNERPFGGIQLVITGDFFQLPPVPDYGREAKFTFESESWNRCVKHTIKLSNVFRQKDQGCPLFLSETPKRHAASLTYPKTPDPDKLLPRQ